MHSPLFRALHALPVGATHFEPTTLAGFAGVMRRVSARSRRPAELSGRAFSCGLFTAVSAANPGDVRYLVGVERTA